MAPGLLALLLAARAAQALPAPPAAPRVVEVFGEVGVHVVEAGESLVELAPRLDVGFNELAAANPGVEPFTPPAGTFVVVPTAWVLPRASAPGNLVVNLSEMRLYLLPEGGGAPVTFPVGGAAEAGDVPLGRQTVVEKLVAPTWYPTPAIREEDPELPRAVPPGPDNPLGSHALRLSSRTIMIHGTNMPFGIGRRVSHGCIRLYPDDIPRLFELVRVGTPVFIVREPVKAGLRDGRVFLEVHDDPAAGLDLVDEAARLLAERGLLLRADFEKVARAARERHGLPADVTAGGD